MVHVGDIVVVSDDNECLYCAEDIIHDIRNQYFIIVDKLTESEKDYPKSACKIMNGNGCFSWIDSEHLVAAW